MARAAAPAQSQSAAASRAKTSAPATPRRSDQPNFPQQFFNSFLRPRDPLQPRKQQQILFRRQLVVNHRRVRDKSRLPTHPPHSRPIRRSAIRRNNVTSPAEGRTSCAAIRSNVVFPEPFRPASTTHSPARNFQRHPAQRVQPAISFLDFSKRIPRNNRRSVTTAPRAPNSSPLSPARDRGAPFPRGLAPARTLPPKSCRPAAAARAEKSDPSTNRGSCRPPHPHLQSSATHAAIPIAAAAARPVARTPADRATGYLSARNTGNYRDRLPSQQNRSEREQPEKSNDQRPLQHIQPSRESVSP